MTQATPDELWTRYVDWCSAQVAKRFLEMSPEQTWELADRARALPPDLQGLTEGGASYLELVRLVTLQLFSEMALPAYSEWLERYMVDPAANEDEMMRFGDSPIPIQEA
ncbi:hypothetical protein BH23GEM6_BH23GEM6_15270 [soil metagenome]